MYSYNSYGLGVHSSFPLDELCPGDPPPDVLIRQARSGEEPFFTHAVGESTFLSEISVTQAHFFWKGIGAFQVNEGREIVVWPDSGFGERTFRLRLLEEVMTALLLQRGCYALHASAISREGVAVSFLGKSGAGKSTLASFFHGRGYSVAADDVTAIQIRQGQPVILPSFSKYHSDPSFSLEPVPLAALYVLKRREEDRINPLSPAEAFIEITRYACTFESCKKVRPHRYFHEAVFLATHVPGFDLRTRHGGPEALLETALQIEKLFFERSANRV